MRIRKSTYFFDPRSHGGAREHFTKIQKHLISAFFAVNIGFQSLKIRISALFSDPRSRGGAREHFPEIKKHLVSTG